MMSNQDPFGFARPLNSCKPRSKDGIDMGSVLRQVGETVGTQLKRKGMRGWTGASGMLGACDVVIGACILFYSFSIGDSNLGATSIAVGGGLVLLGALSVLSLKKDITSIKTLHLTLAVVVGLLSASYTNQVLFTIRSHCILAETYMRLDHLENSMHTVRHEELINGIMMRLDHFNTDIQHLRKYTDDKIGGKHEKATFKQMDAKYVEEKLRDLVYLAEEGTATLERQIRDLEVNITAVDDQRIDTDHRETHDQLMEKMLSLQRHQKSLEPRKQALQDTIKRLEKHMETGVTTDDYSEVLNMLEKHINDKDLQVEVKGEREEVVSVHLATQRLEQDAYDNLIVGDYHEHIRKPTSSQDRQRKKYERLMADIYKRHDNKFGSRERYLHSLNDWLEMMPEHCMNDVDKIWGLQGIGWSAVVLSVATVYVGLTTTLAAGEKKDY